MAKVYLALYKGRKTIKTPKDLAFRIIEWVIRKVTGGQYSHCEIAVSVAFSDGLFDCYSSSFRDGGVRCKRMPLPAGKWDVIMVPPLSVLVLSDLSATNSPPPIPGVDA